MGGAAVIDLVSVNPVAVGGFAAVAPPQRVPSAVPVAARAVVYMPASVTTGAAAAVPPPAPDAGASSRARLQARVQAAKAQP